MTHQNDPVLVRDVSDVFDQFYAVARDLLQIDFRCVRTIALERTPRSTLVPLNDGKALLPGRVLGGKRPLGFARSAMHDDDDWIRSLSPVDRHPLIDATQPNIRLDCD